MSILDSIIITKPGAPRITLYGRPGIGKSTLASQFPDPLFLLTEDNELPGIKALPLILSFPNLWNTLCEMLKLEELPFKTLVLDSVSKLDSIIVEYTIQQSPAGKGNQTPKTLAQAFGGYGAGYDKCADLHRSLKKLFDKFKERGITVIYIAHLEIKKFKSPEQEDYDILSITMNHDKSRQVYVDDVDLVGFCKLQANTTETESGRTLIKSSDHRIISVGTNDAYVSKNRFKMPAILPMSFEEIAKYIPFYNQEKIEESQE